jgi:hypothetical protein
MSKTKFLARLLVLLIIVFTANNLSAQRRGHYSGGKGKSHKGGKYKNPSTGNHYRKRKH